MAGGNRGRYLLLGLLIGGLVGALVVIWIYQSRRVRFRRQGSSQGILSELAAIVRDDILPRIREAIGEAMLGKDAGRAAGSDEEERLEGQGSV